MVDFVILCVFVVPTVPGTYCYRAADDFINEKCVSTKTPLPAFAVVAAGGIKPERKFESFHSTAQ